MFVVLLRFEGDADAGHERAVGALRDVLPDLRWVASYRVQGSYDIVDVVDLQEGEDPAAARRALEAVDGVEAEWMSAEASAMLRAPGGAPGGPPGGAPGGAPGGL